MSILSSSYRSGEAYSAATGIIEVIGDSHSDNPFVVAFVEALKEGTEELRESIAFHDQEGLAEDSEEIDHQFNKAYKKFRGMVEMKAEMDEYGKQADACKVISEILNRHGRDLYTMPKDEQISIFDSVILELKPEEKDSIIDIASIRQLFTPLHKIHLELSEIESRRTTLNSTKKDVTPPYLLTKKITPLLQEIHHHFVAFAKLGNTEYQATLNDLDAKLAPIIARVKARKTRRANKAE